MRFAKSDHCDGDRFFNLPPAETPRDLFKFLRWQLAGHRKKWPARLSNTATPRLNLPLNADEVAVTFVNHATMLLQLPDMTFVTDPVWSKRTSPSQLIGPQRVRPPGIPMDQLPPVDVALVSHNHYDHMDKFTLRELQRRNAGLRTIGALGDLKTLQRFGLSKVTELDWWQTVELRPDVSVTFTPTRHFSGRSLTDRYKTLWGGFLIHYHGHKIYFGGDAGYSAVYQEMYRRFGAMDLCFLPIGAYEPRWFMRDVHMNPAEAVTAHQELHSRLSIGIHFGTFQLTDEAIDQPALDLIEAKKQSAIPDEEFCILAEGETRVVNLSKDRP